MKKSLVLSAIAIVLTACVTANVLSAQQVPSGPVWSDHYRFATISLLVGEAVNGHRTFVPNCTAVIVTPDNGKTGYIVTAKHCFAGISEYHVRFAWQQGEPLDKDLGITLPLIDHSGTQLWTAASDGSDVAGIPLQAIRGSINHRLDGIGLQDFATRDDYYDGATVFIYGYPSFFASDMLKRLTRAITRGGIIAWTDPAGPETRRFLIDAAIFPGNSGGPVFRVPAGVSRTGAFMVGNRVALLGIASQTLSSPLSRSNPNERVEGLGSLGIIEPTSSIVQLLKDMHATFQMPTPQPPPRSP